MKDSMEAVKDRIEEVACAWLTTAYCAPKAMQIRPCLCVNTAAKKSVLHVKKSAGKMVSKGRGLSAQRPSIKPEKGIYGLLPEEIQHSYREQFQAH
jgi:hypothetical protein